MGPSNEHNCILYERNHTGTQLNQIVLKILSILPIFFQNVNSKFLYRMLSVMAAAFVISQHQITSDRGKLKRKLNGYSFRHDSDTVRYIHVHVFK